jgi:FkbM family methyltransferase
MMSSLLNRSLAIVLRRSGRTPEGALEIVMRKLYFRAIRRTNPAVILMNCHRLQVFHRRTSADLFVIWQCFYRQQYEIPVPEFHRPYHKLALEDCYREILARGKRPLIVDCGANIGTSCLWFHARYPEAHIIAVEPAPDNAHVLRENCAGNGIEVVEGAIAATDAMMRLVDPNESTNGYRTVPADHSGQETGAEVTGLSLATLLARESVTSCEPFLLKIDIEGSEKSLFKSDWSSFDRFPLIILEQHDFMMPGRSTADGFLHYHAARHRDFLYGVENIFSIDYNLLAQTGH